jgi:ABC-type multidrug transport system fused ATPase/permease subunit
MRTGHLRALLAAIRRDRQGRRWLWLSQVALVGMVVFDLLIPQAIRGIVNNGILGGDFDWVIRGSLYMAVFAIASMLFATANSWFAARVGEEVGHRLRVTQYSRIAGLSWGNVDRLETSDLLVRLTTDVNQFAQILNMALQARAGSTRVFEILDEYPRSWTGPPPTTSPTCAVESTWSMSTSPMSQASRSCVT